MKRFMTVIVSAKPNTVLGGHNIKQRVFRYSSSEAAVNKAHCLVHAGLIEQDELVIQASVIDAQCVRRTTTYRNESNYERFDELFGDWQERRAS